MNESEKVYISFIIALAIISIIGMIAISSDCHQDELADSICLEKYNTTHESYNNKELTCKNPNNIISNGIIITTKPRGE